MASIYTTDRKFTQLIENGSGNDTINEPELVRSTNRGNLQLTAVSGVATFKGADVGEIKPKVGKQKIVLKSNKQFDKGALLDFRELKLIPIK